MLKKKKITGKVLSLFLALMMAVPQGWNVYAEGEEPETPDAVTEVEEPVITEESEDTEEISEEAESPAEEEPAEETGTEPTPEETGEEPETEPEAEISPSLTLFVSEKRTSGRRKLYIGSNNH